MLAGIREILVITTPEDQASVPAIAGDGSTMGLIILPTPFKQSHAVWQMPLLLARISWRRRGLPDPGGQYILWARVFQELL